MPSQLIIGRVVSLEGGQARVQPFPTPRLSRTERVLRAAQNYVRVARRANNRDEQEKALKELREAVNEFEHV